MTNDFEHIFMYLFNIFVWSLVSVILPMNKNVACFNWFLILLYVFIDKYLNRHVNDETNVEKNGICFLGSCVQLWVSEVR